MTAEMITRFLRPETWRYDFFLARWFPGSKPLDSGASERGSFHFSRNMTIYRQYLGRNACAIWTYLGMTHQFVVYAFANVRRLRPAVFDLYIASSAWRIRSSISATSMIGCETAPRLTVT